MEPTSFIAGFAIGVICSVLTIVLWALANNPDNGGE